MASKLEVQSNYSIKFCFKLGETQTEALQMFTTAYGEGFVSKSMLANGIIVSKVVKNWFSLRNAQAGLHLQLTTPMKSKSMSWCFKIAELPCKNYKIKLVQVMDQLQ